MKNLSFDQRVCRFEYRPHVGDPKAIVNLMVRSGVEVLVASGMHSDGWAAFESQHAIAHPDMDPTFIPDLLRLAHRKGLMVLSWYNMGQNVPLGRTHPHWHVIKRDLNGKRTREDTFLCVFSSPYREFVKAFSLEILEQGFDGLWYDGAWAGSNSAPSCYCRYCRKAFKQDTGHAIPETVDWDRAVFREWVRWRYGRFDGFVTDLYHHLTSAKPDTVVMMNHYNRPHLHTTDPTCGTSWLNGVPIDVMRFPGGGGNENTSIMNRLHTTGFNARIVKAQCPHRFDVWEPGGTLWRSVMYGQLENDKTHSILHGVWTLALGGVPWTACVNSITTRGKPDPTLMNALKRRRPYIGGDPLKYCAVHYSQAARDFRGRNTPGAYYTEVYGLYDVAVEGHYLTDLILDAHLADPAYLGEYRVIVLPNSACLSRKQAAALREFVRQGGVLVSSYETSLYDEDGRRLKNFRLADVFGVTYRETVELTPGPWGDTIYDRDNIPAESPLLRIEDRAFRRRVAPYVFFGAHYTRVRAGRGARTFASTVTPAPTKQRVLFPADAPMTVDGPAVVVNRYGRGYSVYFAPEVGRGFGQWPHPEARQLIEHMLDLGHPAIRVRAPKIVEMTAFRHDTGALAVHLVQLPPASNRPPVPPIGIPVIDEIIPIHDIELRIRDANLSRATLPLSRRKPTVHRAGRDLVIRVPQLDHHEVVWVT